MTRAEFYEVAKLLKPDLSWQQYRRMWRDFERVKLNHMMAQRGMRVVVASTSSGSEP